MSGSALRERYRRLPARLRLLLRAPRHPFEALVRACVAASARGRVLQGPFAGMRWPLHGSPPAYLLGSYEAELHAWLERLGAQPLSRVIDLGAAEGYYAVGLARLLPQARVVAFESQLGLHRELLRVARANGVESRIELRGEADREALARELGDGRSTLLLSDVEGAELDLIDPERLPALRRCWLLIEAHELYRPGCVRVLGERLAPSHRLEQVEPGRRPAPVLPRGLRLLQRLAPPALERVLADQRMAGPLCWLLAQPGRAPRGQEPAAGSSSSR